MSEISINDRITGTIEMLREIAMGFTPWLDAQDAKAIIPVLRDALTTIQSAEARTVQAVINTPCLDDNGYICKKQAVLAAISEAYK